MVFVSQEYPEVLTEKSRSACDDIDHFNSDEAKEGKGTRKEGIASCANDVSGKKPKAGTVSQRKKRYLVAAGNCTVQYPCR